MPVNMRMNWTVQFRFEIMSDNAPTIRRLAELCHVSKSTVAMALRNDPRVAEATRHAIKEVAAREGYTSDERINRLMSFLRRRQRNALWNVAWINSSPDEHTWTRIPWFTGYLQGARHRALELGYTIDLIWTHGLTARRLIKILNARNIKGFLIPLPEKTALWDEFAWDAFSAVVVDEYDVRLQLPRVMADRHGNMRMLLDQLAKLGYRRPALWLQRRVDEISDAAYSSAFLGCRYQARDARPNIWLFVDLEAGEVERKLQTHRPDVIVCSHSGMTRVLREAGRRVPEDVAVAHLNLATDVAGWSGVEQRQEIIGATALDALNTLLTAGQTGLLTCSQVLSIPGKWNGGATTFRLVEK